MSAVAAKKERITSMYRKMQRDFWSLAQPVDLTALERSGALTKIGNWYRVDRPNELPKSLWIGAQIIRIKEQTLIKVEIDRAYYQRLASQAGVDWQGPEPS